MRATIPVLATPPVLDTERIELPLDERSRLMLVEAEFRPPVNRTTQFDHPRCQRFVYVDRP